MDRIDPLNATVAGEPYRNANVDTGDEGSYPDARAFDAVMTEIVHAISALGVVPDDADWTQLGQAIISYIAANSFAPSLLADIVLDGAGNLTRSLKNVNHSANFAFVADDRGKRHRFDTASKTGTLLTAAAAGDGWNIQVLAVESGCAIASPATNIYVNGDAAAVASYTFADGEWGVLICNGENYFLTTNKPPSQLTSGFYSAAVDYGTITGGTLTPTYVGGNFGIGIANGAFTLAAPTVAGNFTLILELTNGAAAGAVTASGYATADLSALTTTVGDKFRYYIVKLNGSSTVRAEALQ